MKHTARALLILFRMGVRGKSLPLLFIFRLTSLKVRISPQNFLIFCFSFNPFATLLENAQAIPSTSPILLNLNQDCLSLKGYLCKFSAYFLFPLCPKYFPGHFPNIYLLEEF